MENAYVTDFLAKLGANWQAQVDGTDLVIGWGRDFTDVSPLRGVLLGGGSHDPEVQVTVLPIEEISAAD